MKKILFIILNLISILIEYTLIYLFFNVILNYNFTISTIMTFIILLLFIVLVLVANHQLKLPDDKDEKRPLESKLLEIINVTSKNYNKKFNLHYVTLPQPNPAWCIGNDLYINNSIKVNPLYLPGIVAHELGHAMHSYYSEENNKVYNASYRIFVAEVASTTNEILLANYVLNNTDDIDLKLEILNNLIDTIDGTIYRQTMFAEFEDFMYKTVEKEKPFTTEVLGDKYLELLKKYNGKEVNTLDISKDSWARVDHFYYGYYVYKYATSMAAALALSKGILKGDQKQIDKYLKFLTLGGSMDPLDELKIAGVDLTNPKVIEDALEMFEHYVNEYYELIKQKGV